VDAVTLLQHQYLLLLLHPTLDCANVQTTFATLLLLLLVLLLLLLLLVVVVVMLLLHPPC
jgi:hypothetical protein